MSDFDKEAEREKLREKYERDKQEREATQRMSDLLLKGARMTNTHCNTCGDPLFQQNGTTFCPSCHGSAEGVEASTTDQSAGEGARGADATGTEPGTTTSNGGSTAAPPNATEPAESGESATDATETISNGRASSPQDSTVQSGNGPANATTPTTTHSADARVPPTDHPQSGTAPDPVRDSAGNGRSSPAPVDGDLEAAQDALVESLERFARKAAETDDPRYAKECLEAAREASEALSALR